MEVDRETLTPGELKKFLVAYFQKDPEEVPALMIWGAPGVGKTQIVRQAAREVFYPEHAEEKLKNKEDFYIKIIHLTLADPTDLKGLPMIKEDLAIWLPPSQLPKEGRDAERGVLFFDEIASAPPAVQTAAHRLILEGRLEEYEKPEGWFVIGASNRRSDRALVYEMTAPLANRFVHLEVEPDLDSWKSWAYKNNIREEIISFLNWRPEFLLDMSIAKESKAFPSPRSWEFASKILNMKDSLKSKDLLRKLLTGAVGQGPAYEFVSFLDIYQRLPDVEEILDRGKDIVPKEPSEMYALIGAIISRYKKNPKKYAKRILDYSFKLEGDFAVCLVRDAIHVNSEVLVRQKKWDEWAKTFVTEGWLG
ncbi:MAG: AAA family ATPase [Candidatus Methanospirareceae archaeon]